MAGIGFTLRSALAKRTLTGTLRAYGVGALVSSGPWVVSILSLAVIGALFRPSIDRQELIVFFSAITHVFALSLILTGPVQMVVARYVADLIYLRRSHDIFPAFLGGLSVTTGGAAVVGFVPAFGLSVDPVSRVAMLSLFATTSSVWVGMLFVSAAKRYERVFASFLAGGIVSVVGAWVGGVRAGLPGLLCGYACGQALLLYGLIAVVAAEFPRGRGVSFEFFGHFRRHPRLAVIGFAFNLAIWVDKLLFWHHPEAGTRVLGFLHASLVYDLPAYLAYLSIVPGVAIFIVRLETDFAESYHRFFDSVLHRGSLDEIRRHKEAMVTAMSNGTRRLLRVQGAFCLLLIIVAPALVGSKGLQWVQLPVLRVHLVGVVPQLVLMVTMTGLFYLDAQRAALKLSFLFLIANGICTAVSLALGTTWYGYGLVVAVMLTAAVGVALLNREMTDLEYVTFTRQPMEPSASGGAVGSCDPGDPQAVVPGLQRG